MTNGFQPTAVLKIRWKRLWRNVWFVTEHVDALAKRKLKLPHWLTYRLALCSEPTAYNRYRVSVRKYMETLGKHKLDGGIMTETLAPEFWEMTVEVKPQKIRHRSYGS